MVRMVKREFQDIKVGEIEKLSKKFSFSFEKTYKIIEKYDEVVGYVGGGKKINSEKVVKILQECSKLFLKEEPKVVTEKKEPPRKRKRKITDEGIKLFEKVFGNDPKLYRFPSIPLLTNSGNKMLLETLKDHILQGKKLNYSDVINYPLKDNKEWGDILYKLFLTQFVENKKNIALYFGVEDKFIVTDDITY